MTQVNSRRRQKNYSSIFPLPQVRFETMATANAEVTSKQGISNSQSTPNGFITANTNTTAKHQSQQNIPQATQSSPNSSQKRQQSSTNVVGVHYKIGRKIGEGSFGIIYEGKSRFYKALIYSTLCL